MLYPTTQNSQGHQYIPESLNYKKTKKSQNAYSTTIKTKSQLRTLNITSSRRDRPKIKSLINHRLYEQYSSSQNYYYMKDVNAILANQRIPSVIKYRDMEDQMKKEEVLRRVYFLEEYDSKFQQLTEYYKFHKEIPRIFSKNEYDIYFDYHDRKRKVDFVQITNMLKMENGEDPYLERRLELIRRREQEYDPILANLSSFVRSSYRASPKNGQRYFLSKNKILDQSSTILDIYDKLNDIVSLSSILSFENSRDISLDNLTVKSKLKRDNIGKNKSTRRSKDFEGGKEGKLSSKRSNFNEINMETSLLFKKSNRDRVRSGISSDVINDKIMEIQFGSKKASEKISGNFIKKKKKNLVKSEVAHNRSKSRVKSKKKKHKKSEIFKKYSDKALKTAEEDQKGKTKLGKFNWTRLNKNLTTNKKSTGKISKRSKRKEQGGKTESSKASKKKANSNRNYSSKASKGSFATTRHNRESSLDRFREELSKFKFSKSTKQSQKTLKSSRSKKGSGKLKGHYKTKSEIGLGNLAYLTRFDSKNSQVSSNNHIRRKSGGKLDLDFVNEKKKNFFSKKKNDKSSLKVKKFQFDNIYKTRFSNLKQELKFFKNQRKSKPITFGSGGSKKGLKSAKVSSKRSKKYMTKKNQHRVESLSDMKFLKKSREKYSSDKSGHLLSAKILNKSKEPIIAKRGKHKHTRSEPEKLLMHNFIKKNENEVNFKAYGGFKNLVDVGRNNDLRRESQPFNSYRSKRRGNSSGAANFGKLLYSSRNM